MNILDGHAGNEAQTTLRSFECHHITTQTALYILQSSDSFIYVNSLYNALPEKQSRGEKAEVQKIKTIKTISSCV